jgi:heme/copper-type cytochrome/quinol oxidase subunit 4
LLILAAQPVDLLVVLLQALAQIFVFLFQFLHLPEGRAGVCACHTKLR